MDLYYKDPTQCHTTLPLLFSGTKAWICITKILHNVITNDVGPTVDLARHLFDLYTLNLDRDLSDACDI